MDSVINPKILYVCQIVKSRFLSCLVCPVCCEQACANNFSYMLPMFCLQEGTSNYFKGLMLMLCYLIVAASFFVHVDTSPGQF
jgi:predicted permease